ncbi:right-handed parallel beta-helix repeat-containing protein [Zhihengliuella sp. ISTPL4]|uniref:right-handed parallel beta-helix repeat-containing protein n=1 Tax=Zhihengliuella sp. ISTPL4 TaxID=2058657 RepID=UPI000C795749|nr:right-handed parallel beta-helix repeat-containing protein [Zhihengliuella sp. ISTPL4]
MNRTIRASIAVSLAIAFSGSGLTAPASAAVAVAAESQAPARTVFSDDFAAGDGAHWNVTTANAASQVTYTGGMVNVKGSGPENRILTKDVIAARDFTLSLDLFIHAGNTNSAIKFGFFATEGAASRYQVTYDAPKSRLAFERVVQGATTLLDAPAAVSLPVNTGGNAHRVEISVDGDRVRASVGGQVLLDTVDADMADAAAGRIVVASQFPNQDYSIDNIVVTTDETEAVGEYTVDVATETNGVRDSSTETAGGTLTASRSSGNAGDGVTLTFAARPGYIFDGYVSLRADTMTSTDGLLTISDNRFTLDDKTGSVVIIATFVTEPADPNLLFRDDFTGALNANNDYDIQGEAAVRVEDEALVLAPTTGTASAFVHSSSWANPKAYRIEADIRKADTVAGTAQIAFRGAGMESRYVLALNGSKALLRRIDAGANVELASTGFVFDQTTRRVSIDVTDDTVSVTVDGSPLLSYVNVDSANDTAEWSGLGAGAGVINMTAGSSIAVDNLTIFRTPVQVEVSVEISKDGVADAERTAGAVVLSRYTASAGDTVTWNAYPKGAHLLQGLSWQGAPVPAEGFTIPKDAAADVVLTANFTSTALAPTTYYIDPVGGADSNAGTSADTAWASFSALNRAFGPGDRILLKRGSVFSGDDAALRFQGSGSANAPIEVGAYGDGPRPRLDGAGEVENVISLFNQEHVSISGLEITNLHPGHDSRFGLNTSTNQEKNLRAVNVSARDFGVVSDISLTDLHIHDINGNLSSKWNGGIFFDIGAAIEGGELRGVPTKFDGILIADNVIERVDRSGIKLVSSSWANQSAQNSPNVPLFWYPSTGIVLRDNQIRYTGGDGITVRDADGALIEYNLVQHARYQNTGYNAGIWPFQATNTVIQYNVSHTHGVQDGQGLDTDHVSSYSVMQYNYSHDNEGGFMLIMNGFPHTAPTIRYNISQNDADKTFEFSRGTAAGTMIYNNTIFSDSLLRGPRGGVLDLANSAAGTGNREVFIFNNVFHYPEGQPFYVGEAATMRSQVRLYNNAYAGGITAPAEEEQAVTGDLGLPEIGDAPANIDISSPRTGANVGTSFDGYTPAEDSALRGAGVTLAELVAHYDGTVTDRRDLSPTEIHAVARQNTSIDMVAAWNLPEIGGVTYDTDFRGAALPSDTARVLEPEGITVGAVQFAPAESTGGGTSDGVSSEAGGEVAPTGAALSADSAAAVAALAQTGSNAPLILLVGAALTIIVGWRLHARRSRT